MRVLVLALAMAAISCGGHPAPPPNGVVQADLGSWKFRRYQRVLDVEVWVDNNKAEAFTASYVAGAAEQSGHINDKDVVNVFVTRYATDAGVLRETVKLARRLAAEQGYQVDEAKVGGTRALTTSRRRRKRRRSGAASRGCSACRTRTAGGPASIAATTSVG